jgi:hypothetical protein
VPTLARIAIFPIKSLDGIFVEHAEVAAGGALLGDREFALLDAKGNYIQGKRNPKVHQLRTTYDLPARMVMLKTLDNSMTAHFHLDAERDSLAVWLSEFFQQSVRIVQNVQNGFPDDAEAWGPTLTSTASLAEVASWYPDLSLEQMRLRFRTNLEIADVPAFWEDRLFAAAGETVSFQVGDVQFLGTNPCLRCPVPTRDPLTGAVYANFQKIFATQRQATLPAWAERSRFNSFYRFTLNTRIPLSEAGKQISVGDTVQIC